MLMLLLLMMVSIAPVSLRLLDMLPPNGSPAILALVVLEASFTGGLTLMTTIALTSMIIDVVEDSEVKTGRRSEGLLVSVDNIVKKSIAGFGVFSVGAILRAVGLSENVRPGAVPEASLNQLGLFYIPCVVAIYVGAMHPQFRTRRPNFTTYCSRRRPIRI